MPRIARQTIGVAPPQRYRFDSDASAIGKRRARVENDDAVANGSFEQHGILLAIP